eukprot:g5106.t1
MWRALGVGATFQFWCSILFGSYMTLAPAAAAAPLLDRVILTTSFVAFSGAVLFGVNQLGSRLITRIESERTSSKAEAFLRIQCLGTLAPNERHVRTTDIYVAQDIGSNLPFTALKAELDGGRSEILFIDSHSGTVHDMDAMRKILFA